MTLSNKRSEYILLQRTPSCWSYPIERGAITIWETWEGHDVKDNRTMSHNHYALGTVSG